MDGWRSARINANPRYVYNQGRDCLILRWTVNQWVVEWYVPGSRDMTRETLPGTFTETEAQAAALAIWRMK